MSEVGKAVFLGMLRLTGHNSRAANHQSTQLVGPLTLDLSRLGQILSGSIGVVL